MHADTVQRAVVLVGPELAQRVLADDLRQRRAQLLGDLDQQGAREAVLLVGAEVAPAVAAVVPDRRVQAVAPQRRQPLDRECGSESLMRLGSKAEGQPDERCNNDRWKPLPQQMPDPPLFRPALSPVFRN